MKLIQIPTIIDMQRNYVKSFTMCLFMCSCNSDFVYLRDGIVDAWWHLDGDDINANIYLTVDERYLNEGDLWFDEYDPMSVPEDNFFGGTWKLPSGNELELAPSSELKQLVKDVADIPGAVVDAIQLLQFDIQKLDGECYSVTLEKMAGYNEHGVACPYHGNFSDTNATK